MLFKRKSRYSVIQPKTRTLTRHYPFDNILDTYNYYEKLSDTLPENEEYFALRMYLQELISDNADIEGFIITVDQWYDEIKNDTEHNDDYHKHLLEFLTLWRGLVHQTFIAHGCKENMEKKL